MIRICRLKGEREGEGEKEGERTEMYPQIRGIGSLSAFLWELNPAD